MLPLTHALIYGMYNIEIVERNKRAATQVPVHTIYRTIYTVKDGWLFLYTYHHISDDNLLCLEM